MPTQTTEAIQAVERAHKAFSIAALRKLHPDLQGALLGAAVGREHLRDQQYLTNMRKRLRAAKGSPAALDAERRYLAQHIAAAGWRMRSEADVGALKAAGEPGAVWVLDDTKKNHTADCVRLAGRFWPWSVLDRVNPGNRHNGCGCRLASRDEAQRQGIVVKAGRRSVSVRKEVAAGQPLLDGSTVIPRWDPEKHPHGTGSKFVVISGHFADPGEARAAHETLLKALGTELKRHTLKPEQRKAYEKDLQTARDAHDTLTKMAEHLHGVKDAVAARDLPRLRDHQEEMRRLVDARNYRPPQPHRTDSPAVAAAKQTLLRQRANTIQTMHRVNEAITNPDGAAPIVGASTRLKPAVGSVKLVPVGMSTAGRGIIGPWTRDQTFAWSLPRSAGSDTAAENLARGKAFTVKTTDSGHFIQTAPGRDPKLARQEARLLELRRQHFRRARVTGEGGDPLHDDRQLDVGPDEKKFGAGVAYDGTAVTDRQVALAGKLAAAAAAAAALAAASVATAAAARGVSRDLGATPRVDEEGPPVPKIDPKMSFKDRAKALEPRLQYLVAHDLTTTEIARQLGIKQQQVSRYMAELQMHRGRGHRTDLASGRQVGGDRQHREV